MVTKGEIIFPDGSSLQDAYDNGVTVCTAATKPSSPFEGQVIYVTDNSAGDELEAYDGAAWQAVGGITNIVEDTTPQLGGDLDCNGKKLTGVTTIETTGTIVFTKV